MIVFHNNVIDEFDDLIFVLYSSDYFSSMQSAEAYTDKIIDFISDSIETFPAQITPKNYNISVQGTYSIKPITELHGLSFTKTKIKNI